MLAIGTRLALAAVAFAIGGGVALHAVTPGWENKSPGRKKVESGRVYWSAEFSRGLAGFSVEKRDGAEGTVGMVDVPGGGKALRIVKSNDLGYIAVTAKEPFAVAGNARLQACASVSSGAGDPESSLGFLRMYGRRRDLKYFSGLDGRGPGGPKMDFLFSVPEDEPYRKLCRYLASEADGTNVTPAIVVAGARSDSVWRDWYVEDLGDAERRWRDFLKNVEPADHSGDMQDAAEFAESIARDVDHTARVAKENGAAVLKVDGKTVAPVIFKGKIAARGSKNLYCGRKMEESGVRLQVITVRFGDSPSSPGVWHAGDRFDVDTAVGNVRDAMRMAKDSLFMLTLILDAYPEFSKEHPDEVWKVADGRIVWGNQVHAEYNLDPSIPRPKHWPWISNHSLVWRSAVKRHISTLVARLRSEGLAKRIVGVHLAGYHDHQFSTRQLDYSPPAAEGFRLWQQRKYGDVKWRELPGFDPAVTYFVPGRDQAQIDFYTFLKEGPFEMQEDIACHAKAAFGKEMVALRWCMAAFGGTYGSAYDITAFTRSKVIDILVAQPSYTHRIPGAAIGLRLPDASFHENGKLFLNEFDIRTYGAVSGGESELRVLGLSQATDFPMWQSIYRKLAGQMVAERMGWWFYDMAGGWFEPPEIAADIRKTVSMVRYLGRNRPSPWRPSAAVVIDEEGTRLRNTPGNYYNFDEETLFGDQMRVLGASGVPYDVWLADDIIRDPSLAQRYRAIVFAGMYCIDESRRKMLESLKSKGRTLVFLSGTGVSGGADATGFDFVRKEPPQSHMTVAAEGVEENVANVLETKALTRFAGTMENLAAYRRPRCDTVRETPGMRVVARFAGDGTPAIAERRMDGWKGVVVGSAGGLSPQYFNRLVRDAGGYVPVDGGCLQVNMNGDFVSLHGLKPVRCSFRLPFRCRVRNLKNGEWLGWSDSIPLDMSAGETCWFALDPVRE